ncbi:arginine-glutamic acid dipeptide repeats protein [Seriola aureovittata]|uniref:arginine-glutamic acid dipeptide repeats protein n=1 Tax=Seriola aureovittata TaxID=2871759 RepID=UPI0024BDF3D3|nr:arginine-glutamic acid dipeptide repeats protein [Seriola aureovittata]XP_056234963.1 arginine-glutamic acid dipeptide repeats protein [Seriola aureovittata]XP_056234964.1 arginine-glutamic acid dipeptide repeats protein [Seriola aureovittata]
MFSDSQAPAPGEQRGFKPHAPHFIPWLRNSLKSHHSSDLGLNGPYKSNSEGRNNLTPLERAKGIGFFSIQGKDRSKKGDLRCNGVGMARMLPVMLRGPHILPGSLGKRREDSPVRWNQSPELDPDSKTQISPGDGPQGLDNSSSSAQDNHTVVRNHSSHLSLLHSQNDRTSASARKYGPLVGPPHVPAPALLAEESNCKVPVVVCTEDRKGKVWDYASQTTYRQRDLHSCSWLSPDTRGLIERQHGFSSSLSYIKQQSRNSQSQRDLTALRDPAVEGFNGPLSRVIFSTEVPQRDPGCTATLRGPRKPRPSSERIAVLGQNQTWVRHGSTSEGESQRKEAGCSRKAVRNQIKRVVNNLEQVLTALRDVHQEMKEVVQQIDYLTSSIDLNEEEQQGTGGGDGAKPPSDSSSSSGSSSSEVTLGSTYQRPSEPEDQPVTTHSSGTLRRDHHSRGQSPPSVQLCPVSSGVSSERSRTLRFTCSLGSPPRQSGPMPYNSLPSSSPPQPQSLTSDDLTLPPQRILPVRPPTPGLSPLTVNLHPPNSPGSQPHSPAPSSPFRISPVSPSSPLSPKSQAPPALSPSVIIETKVGSYQTPQSDHPSAGSLSPSSTQPPCASCPPTDTETQAVSNADRESRASSEAPAHTASQVCAASAATAKPPVAQSRRGRKPPPYPHHRFSEHTKRAKETRKAPPYPEKRRLLSTTV